jgi:predicted nucleic acid-binding protein
MKVLLDTNVLIRFFRDPLSLQSFETRARRPLVYLSSVVALELFAGCSTARQVKALKRFLKPFEKAGRMIVPDYGCFAEAGRVLAALGGEGLSRDRRALLVNDALIAVSGARSGCVVVTANAVDFAAIARHSAVRWMPPE